jgi:hypothetical protein
MILSEFVPSAIRQAFTGKVSAIASRLGFDPNWLMAVIYSESGFNPAAVNPKGNATGLIQFMPATAKWLGTSIEALAKMNRIQQLDWVEKFYSKFGRHLPKVNQFTDLYLLTFYPKALIENWPDSRVFPDIVYKMNINLDLNRDKKLTVGEFRTWALRRVNNKLPDGMVMEDIKKKSSPEA